MKLTKKLMSILLAALLGLALLAPGVMAQDYALPEYTYRLDSMTYAELGESITLEPKVQLPAGVEAQLQYQWYETEWHSPGQPENYAPIEGATEPKLTVCLRYEEQNFQGTAIMFCEERYYYLQAYYVAEDGTVVYNNDFTTVLFRYKLSDVCTFLLSYFGLPSSGALAELCKVLVAPAAVPLYLLELMTIELFKLSIRLS